MYLIVAVGMCWPATHLLHWSHSQTILGMWDKT